MVRGQYFSAQILVVRALVPATGPTIKEPILLEVLLAHIHKGNVGPREERVDVERCARRSRRGRITS